jgi:hypothetical protein
MNKNKNTKNKKGKKGKKIKEILTHKTNLPFEN